MSWEEWGFDQEESLWIKVMVFAVGFITIGVLILGLMMTMDIVLYK